LGESETLYAWALMAKGIGELLFYPVIGYMAQNLPYSVSQLVAALMFAVGGAIYALASAGWVVMLGNFVLGCGISCAVLVHTYIGEMGTKMDRMRSKKRKRPLKFVLYIVFSFILNGGYLVTFRESFSYSDSA